jgi:8-oxo-dGTP diphosphatase
VRAAAQSGGPLVVGLTARRARDAARIRVVAAVLVRTGRVLAARRLHPVGGWEFPGGKVEDGESPSAAIERECHEELGISVRALAHIATATDERIELLVWHVELLAGTPRALQDHDELRWLTAAELNDVGWLPIDRTVLGAVADVLR